MLINKHNLHGGKLLHLKLITLNKYYFLVAEVVQGKVI